MSLRDPPVSLGVGPGALAMVVVDALRAKVPAEPKSRNREVCVGAAVSTSR